MKNLNYINYNILKPKSNLMNGLSNRLKQHQIHKHYRDFKKIFSFFLRNLQSVLIGTMGKCEAEKYTQKIVGN